MKDLLKKHADKIRFGIVGAANTVIDFCVLFLLVGAGYPTLASNIISTSVALAFSFNANKKYTFKTIGKGSIAQIVLFLVITLSGLWIMQPIIIRLISAAISPWELNSFTILFIGKSTATIFTLIWNYLLYRKFVFKKEKA